MSDQTNDPNIIDLPQITSEASESVHNVPFSMVSRELIQKSGLSPEARMLIIYLISFPPGWIFYDEVIRRDLDDVGRDKLERMFRELRKKGYVQNIPIRGTDGKVCGSKRIFSATPEFKAFHRNPEKPGVGDSTETLENQGPGKPGPGKPAANNINSNNIKINKINDKKINKKDLIEEKFEIFWKAYPNQGKNKQRALKAFASKIKQDPARFGIIMNAVHAQNRERARCEELNKELLRDNKKEIFIPHLAHASTWLNEERWENSVRTEEELNAEYNRNRNRGSNKHQVEKNYDDQFNAHVRNLAERYQRSHPGIGDGSSLDV
jgi:hypothetical protein